MEIGYLPAIIFDGLLYPTIAMRANADNFALKPRYATTHLEGVRDFAFDITLLDTAIDLSPDGTICWKGRLDQWVINEPYGRLYFIAENGGWVARNKSGEIVQPE